MSLRTCSYAAKVTLLHLCLLFPFCLQASHVYVGSCLHKIKHLFSPMNLLNIDLIIRPTKETLCMVEENLFLPNKVT